MFKVRVLGSVLNLSLVMMMNRMKDEITLPESLNRLKNTILRKSKSKLDLINWRGIFVCNVLRTVLMKLVHETTYDIVSLNMTNSQIGARKDKSVRNHLFVKNL